MDPFSVRYSDDNKKNTFNNGHGLKNVTYKQTFKSSCLRDGEETLRERLKGTVPKVSGKLDVFSFCVSRTMKCKGTLLYCVSLQNYGEN